MTPEIGDKFIINWKKIKETYKSVRPCKLPDSEFIIDNFSKSGLSVYFEDNRENINCSCQICRNHSTWSTVTRCIGISDIIVIQKRLAIERDRKLNQLLLSNKY